MKKAGISGHPQGQHRVKTLIQASLDLTDVTSMAFLQSDGYDGLSSRHCQKGVIGRRVETIKASQSASGAKPVVEQSFPDGVPRRVKISGKSFIGRWVAKIVVELISDEPDTVIGVVSKVNLHTLRASSAETSVVIN